MSNSTKKKMCVAIKMVIGGLVLFAILYLMLYWKLDYYPNRMRQQAKDELRAILPQLNELGWGKDGDTLDDEISIKVQLCKQIENSLRNTTVPLQKADFLGERLHGDVVDILTLLEKAGNPNLDYDGKIEIVAGFRTNVGSIRTELGLPREPDEDTQNK